MVQVGRKITLKVKIGMTAQQGRVFIKITSKESNRSKMGGN